MKQIIEIVNEVERLGSFSLPVTELTKDTKKFLVGVDGIYYVYQPAASVNFVITKAGPNGRPSKDCTILCVGPHNRVNIETWNVN